MIHATTLVLALAATLLPSASAHGFLRSVTIDGKLYKGNTPNVSNFTSPIRVINDITPVKGANNRAVNCGKDAAIAAQVAPANPGSTVDFDWAGGDGSKWPHNVGPMLTYMSTCGNTTCDKFDAINAQWFKIDEVGQRQNNKNEWVQRDLFEGKKHTVKLPTNLAAGQYLLRHEIIALHLGNEQGGAEFYPSCSQIEVSGKQGADSFAIQPSVTVSLPGAYEDNDPGIFVPTIFSPVKNYQFPGPPVSNIMGGAAADNGTANPAPASKPGCPSNRPRQISRMMTKFKRVGPTEAVSV